MSTIAVNSVTDANGGNTAKINSMTPTADSLQGFRNRIINGNMVIDQRNNGASVTPTTSGTYTLDRWKTMLTVASKFSVQRSTTAPTGFANSLLVTSLSAYSLGDDIFSVNQPIEGLNVSDLDWGTANAKTVTLSFWVRSSLTGSFGGAITSASSGAFSYSNSYPFAYTISAANTWEQKTVVISGPTSGTFSNSTSDYLSVVFSLGAASAYSGTAGAWVSGTRVQPTGSVSLVSTNSANLYLTGVQLEVGSVATPFERIDYGRQLIQCQRYCFKFSAGDNYQRYGGGVNGNTTQSFPAIQLPTVMRANPTLTTTGTASNYAIYTGAAVIACSAVPIIDSSSDDVIRPTLQTTVSSGLTQGNYTDLISNNNTTSYLLFSAEL